MPNFNNYMNYTPETGFNTVIYGSDSPRLEVELNESQEIINTYLKYLIQSIVGNYVIGSKLNYTDDSLILEGGFAFTKLGMVIISKLEIDLLPNKNIVLRMYEVEVDKDSILYKYGNLQGGIIPNPILDKRINSETTKRKLIQYDLLMLEHIELDNATDVLIFKTGKTTSDIIYKIDTISGESLRERLEREVENTEFLTNLMIEDSLLSDASNIALSALQGKVLNEKIEQLSSLNYICNGINDNVSITNIINDFLRGENVNLSINIIGTMGMTDSIKININRSVTIKINCENCDTKLLKTKFCSINTVGKDFAHTISISHLTSDSYINNFVEILSNFKGILRLDNWFLNMSDIENYEFSSVGLGVSSTDCSIYIKNCYVDSEVSWPRRSIYQYTNDSIYWNITDSVLGNPHIQNEKAYIPENSNQILLAGMAPL